MSHVYAGDPYHLAVNEGLTALRQSVDSMSPVSPFSKLLKDRRWEDRAPRNFKGNHASQADHQDLKSLRG